jgi:hypothetical protein
LGGREGLVIEGTDNAGWTLDGYVLPRLASGLYFGKEIPVPPIAGAVRVTLPYSEVCMHMRVAGKEMWVLPLPNSSMAQLLNEDGSRFSIPVTRGEAGVR